MKKSAWYTTFMAIAALAMVGCGDDDTDPCAGAICVDDAGVDADTPGPTDSGTDSGADTSTPATCGDVGRMGGLCRNGTTCSGSLECYTEYGSPTGGYITTELFGLPQTVETEEGSGRFVARETPVPADWVPVIFAAGSLCSEQCDTSASTDSCGSCAKCSSQLGNDLGFGIYAFFGSDERLYGNDTGICRPHCTFDVNGRGQGCPEGYSCDPFTNLCFEACVNDASCQSALVITEDGEYGTYRIPGAAATCDATTGRCRWTNPATNTVGDECDSQSDCTADVGFCLRGGTCAEVQCGTASDTMSNFVCDGGRGICLGTGGNNGSICIQGCTTSADCNPGNACQQIGSTAGSFTGYCFPTCDASTPCRSGETCAIPDGETEGTCVPSCNPTDNTGCEADELCVGTGTAGYCEPLNGLCFDGEGCIGGQICNSEIVEATFGRCVNPCDPEAEESECATGTECVAEGALQGLCATPCTAPAACGTGFTCQIPAGGTSGYCVVAPTP